MADLSPEMAEVIGFLLGDGCRSRYVKDGRVIQVIAFAGNAKEMECYREFVRSVIIREFGVAGYLGLDKM